MRTVLDVENNPLTGYMSSLTGSVTVNTIAPSAPYMDKITTPTKNKTPTITGTGVNGHMITLYEGSNIIGSTTVESSTWSIKSITLGDGSYTITANATDPYGNVSSDSISQKIVIRTNINIKSELWDKISMIINVLYQYLTFKE